MTNVKAFWNQRSKLYQEDPRGVLFGNLYPSFINRSFHLWSVSQITSHIPPHQKFKILDAGCGYGRVSEIVLNKYPNTIIYGVDTAKIYIDIFQRNLSPRGKGIFSDMRKLPFKNSTFDLVFTVASLMQLTSANDHQKAASELARVLKPKAKLILVERTPLMSYLEILKITGLRKGFVGAYFSPKYLSRLTTNAGTLLLNINHWPSSFTPLYLALTAIKLP